MTKTLIAAATAMTIGLGALGATASPAAAANFYGSAHFSGPGYSITIGDRGWHRGRDFRRCRPVYKTRRVFVPHYGWRLAKVKVGKRCNRQHREYRQYRRWWW